MAKAYDLTVRVRGNHVNAHGNEDHFVGVHDTRPFIQRKSTYKVTYVEHGSRMQVLVHAWTARGWQLVLDFHENDDQKAPGESARHAHEMLHG